MDGKRKRSSSSSSISCYNYEDKILKRNDVFREFNFTGINIDGESGSSSSNIFNPQDQGSPIGLRLSLSVSDINQLELQLSQNTRQQMPPQINNINQQQRLIVHPQPNHHHKLKVSSIPAVYLEIGNWRWESKLHEGDLMAKFYYGMKKLVWEFIDGHLKKKIEIRWSQISAINSSYVHHHQNKTTTTRLQIQV
ncbi:hypothetical protein SSX86_011072 [Deinandra increscens subsp. villosa]|uniref:TRF2/HOY1 PH-like domain-containing protein n=1 Tax=Deinandra increscens subsp. villosa TaxID=3103831 RepID=A0AAP0DCY8_9ASTR